MPQRLQNVMKKGRHARYWISEYMHSIKRKKNLKKFPCKNVVLIKRYGAWNKRDKLLGHPAYHYCHNNATKENKGPRRGYELTCSSESLFHGHSYKGNKRVLQRMRLIKNRNQAPDYFSFTKKIPFNKLFLEIWFTYTEQESGRISLTATRKKEKK